MASEEDEIEVIMQKKSRFSRYRCRIREKANTDLEEAMAIDESSDSEYVNLYNQLNKAILIFT